MGTVNWRYVIGGVLLALVIASAVGLILLRSSSSQSPATNNLFGQAGNTNIPTITGGSNTPAQQTFVYTPNTQKRIFKVADGPVASATYVQTSNPTTTVIRYIRQDSGHVYEQPLDAPGSAMRIISNTTIPGVQNAIWTRNGNSVTLQYAQGSVIKTASISFNGGSTTQQVRFLPDNITGLAASPDGKSLVYLLPTTAGTDGYIADYNGASVRKVFSVPLAQVTVSWPSLDAILLQTKPAAGVAGIVFQVSTKTGQYSPLLYDTALSVTASGDLSHVVYQTDIKGKRTTYDHNMATGQETALSGPPIPEKCAWATRGSAVLVCAFPNTVVPVNYLDLWHQGTASAADILVGFNLVTHTDVAIGTPGNAADGGTKADVADIAVSPDGLYVLYIAKGGRSLWGVNLNQ
jgi:hypothetical protein